MDEFEKWVESISKTASYSDQRELMRVVLNHYRAFKAKQKPTAPASLVEELRSIKIDTITDENTGIDMEVIFPARISEIRSRHEARKEVVLEESIKLYAIDSESGIRVPEIDGHYELHGKRGKLIFVEEP